MSISKRFINRGLDAVLYKKKLDLSEQLRSHLADNSGQLMGALDALYFQNPELVLGWNKLNRSNPEQQLNYTGIAAEILDSDSASTAEKQAAEHYRSFTRQLDTASDPGGANIIPTTLADVLTYRVESAGQVLSRVLKVNVPDGNYEHPKFNKLMLAEFKAETSSFTDAATLYEDGTDGIAKVSYILKDFGLRLNLTQRLIEKTTPGILNSLIDYVATSIARGSDSQILTGSGAGVNATGMIQNATSATVGGDILDTFANAVAALSDVNVLRENQVAFMNGATEAMFIKLRATNESYRDLINPVNRTIQGVPYVVSNLIKTSGGAATLVIGDPKHYVWAQNGDLKQLDDPYSNSSSLQHQYVFYTFAEGKPLYNDSFAKFSVTIA